MLFPPAIIIFFINTGRRVRKGKDIAMVPLYYLRTIFMRVVIWKHSLKNRSFFI
jgi:hypothetical protein